MDDALNVLDAGIDRAPPTRSPATEETSDTSGSSFPLQTSDDRAHDLSTAAAVTSLNPNPAGTLAIMPDATPADPTTFTHPSSSTASAHNPQSASTARTDYTQGYNSETRYNALEPSIPPEDGTEVRPEGQQSHMDIEADAGMPISLSPVLSSSHSTTVLPREHHTRALATIESDALVSDRDDFTMISRASTHRSSRSDKTNGTIPATLETGTAASGIVYSEPPENGAFSDGEAQETDVCFPSPTPGDQDQNTSGDGMNIDFASTNGAQAFDGEDNPYVRCALVSNIPHGLSRNG